MAVLLGTSLPTHNQGQPLLDQLEAPPPIRAARSVDTAAQVTRLYEFKLTAIGDNRSIDTKTLETARDAFRAGDYARAVELSDEAASQAHAIWQAARSASLNRERAARAGIALLFLLPAGLYLLWWHRVGWNAWVPALGAGVYTLLWNVNYHLVQGLTYSTSWFNLESDIQPFLTVRVIEAMIALLFVTVLVGVLRRRAGAVNIARDSVHTMLAVGLTLMVQILVFYILWDVTFEWYLPDFVLGFKYYLDVFQTTVFWPLTPLPLAGVLPLVALASAWVARKAESLFIG